MLFQELKNTVSPNIDISHQEFFFFFQTLKLIIDWGFQTFSAVKESAACVCRGYCSCCCGDIRPDRRTKEARARKSSFHASCFHSSALPVQWNSWWSLNEAELADQADGGTGVDGICEAPSPLSGESKCGQLTWMKSRERELWGMKWKKETRKRRRRTVRGGSSEIRGWSIS